MAFNMDRIRALGADVDLGLEYTGGKDKYISALQRFYKSSANNLEKMKNALKDEDLESLEITVHALKSNSLMIGASGLSEMFETLETACRDKDMAAVNANIRPTLEEYSRYIEALKPLGEMATYTAPGELSADEAKETADRLLEALDDFDDDLSAELANKLSGYPFRITQNGRLKEAIEYIGEFMYDEAAEIIREIYTAIE